MDTNSLARFARRTICPVYWMSVLLCALCSCSNEENTSLSAFGHVSFDVSVIPDTVNLNGRKITLFMESADGQYSHTWDDYRDFSLLEGFYSGKYSAKAVLGLEGAEGYGCECYIGTSDFEIVDNQLTVVRLECTLSQAKVKATAAEGLLARYPSAGLLLHTEGASYVDVEFGRATPALVTPGSTAIFVHLADTDGNDITIDTGIDIPTSANASYDISADIADGVLSVSVGDRTIGISLDEALLDSDAPEVLCAGFSSNVPVYLTEGVPAESRLQMNVQSSGALRSVMLTAVGQNATVSTLPDECDILTDSGSYVNMGLSVERTDDRNITLDFTGLLENLSVLQKVSDMCFMLQAVDVLGRASNVAVLKVSIQAVEMSVVNVSKAMLGRNVASVTLEFNVSQVEGSDFTVVLDDKTTPDVEPLEIISTEMSTDKNHMTINFRVPDGISSLPVRIDYMGIPKVALEIERELPDFNISVDAFATTVVVDIVAPTDAETSAITKYARIMAGGKEMAVLSRDTEKGYLYCTGFEPNKTYVLECVVLKNVAPKTTRISTEKATQVPDGSFEDVTDLIKYDAFPSGGTYSATSFPIFNQQNFVDFNVKWPRSNWASINEKTFCLSAEMHNTWYMQPSAAVDFDNYAAGTKSIRMSSVGWSLHGTEIPPYVQPVDGFASYNANYPAIDNISAGYLFLGSYSFNPSDRTEVSTEGIKFDSRPSYLNGFFKYTPDEGNPSDRGWVRIELVNDSPSGETIVLGSGYMEFAYAPDFRTFNIPITYTTYNVPATRLKILFCSSVYSEGLSFDDPRVPVSPDIPNSRYIGSTLWIDNLSFSY